jgi:glycosyltransferase involved in cell wall biosynthesis
MARFVGIKNNQICVVSDNPFDNADLQILEVPPGLSNVSDADLIVNCRVRDGEIRCKSFKKPADQMKVALVSNYRMRCGLSTYIENLLPEIIKRVGHIKLFIERNDNITGDLYQVGDAKLSTEQVKICWKRGEPLRALIAELHDYDPDVILINHEWGIFSDPKHWLSFLTQLSDYRIIVIMHSTFPNHLDKTIIEASIPEIIVHLEGARQCLLEEKNISGKVYVVPHGCYALENKKPLWNIYKSDHTFIQVGFGLRYKSYADSIYATAILKEKYPDVFFTAIFSETNFAKSEHTMYYRELVSLIDSLNIKENVGIIRGFQSDVCLDSFFRTNKAAVFPYKSFGEHFVYGASGACRLAMSKNIPVITSSIPHFSDVPSIKADTPEQIANELDKLFSEPSAVKRQVEKQKQFIAENSWANISLRYIKIFEE